MYSDLVDKCALFFPFMERCVFVQYAALDQATYNCTRQLFR